jgi:hypothetical protein
VWTIIGSSQPMFLQNLKSLDELRCHYETSSPADIPVSQPSTGKRHDKQNHTSYT